MSANDSPTHQTAALALNLHALGELQHQYERWLEALADVPCDTPEREAWWAEKLNLVQSALKKHEEDRQELQRPILDDQRRINAAYKEAAAPGVKFKELACSKLAEAEKARLLEQEAAQEAVRLAAEAGDTWATEAALEGLQAEVKIAGTSVRQSWTYRIVSLADVPREYLVLDEKKIKAYLRSQTEPSIPGLEFERAVKVQPTGSRK